VVYKTIRDEGMTDIAVCRGLHRAVRALREGWVKKTRPVDEGSGAGVDGNSPEPPKVKDANNGEAEVVQEAVVYNVQVHAYSPTTAAQDSRSLCSEIEDVRSGSAAHRDEGKRGMLRPERDAKLYQESDEALRQSPQFWAPYIHFGV